MSLDLELDDGQRAIADAIAHYCRERCGADAVRAAADRFPVEPWRELASLGLFALGTPDGEGGPLEVVAAMEALGRAVHPGPLVETFLAAQLLGGPERAGLTAGEVIASVGTPPLMPWAPVAGIFVEIDGERAWRGQPRGPIAPLDTLGGEPWGRVELERIEPLGEAGPALALADVAAAAYLAAAGQHLVEAAAEHARTRRQFGRAIGEFQAVAHPLAESAMDLAAASTLARVAAFRLAVETEGARAAAAGARLSGARAALAAAAVAHQVFGALGITLEGPVFHVSRRIRQLASAPGGLERARRTVLEPYRMGPSP